MPKLEFQFGCFAFAGHVVLKLGRPASPLSQIHLTFLVCLAYFGGFFFSPFWPSPKQSLMDPDHPCVCFTCFQNAYFKNKTMEPKAPQKGQEGEHPRKQTSFGDVLFTSSRAKALPLCFAPQADGFNLLCPLQRQA